MKASRAFLITGIVAGTLLTLSPLFGLLGTVRGMMRSFTILEKSGIADPTALSDSVGSTLVSTAVGIVLFPFGIVLLGISIFLLVRLPKAPATPLPPAVQP